MLYPTLKIAINDLVNEIKNKDYYKELENEFNHNFFRNKAEILQKQKLLLKLERGDDYSEGDYEYWLRQNIDMNESKTEKSNDENLIGPGTYNLTLKKKENGINWSGHCSCMF